MDIHEVAPEPLELPVTVEDGDDGGKKRPLRSWSILRGLELVQRYSTYGFTAFTVLHATSVILAPVISPSLGEDSLQLTRALYQGPPYMETLVLGSAVAHVISGTILQVRRAYLHKVRYDKVLKPTPTALSGMLLVPILGAHLALTRAAPLAANEPFVGLDFYAHFLNTHPWLGVIGTTAFVYISAHHILLGWKRWLRWKRNIQIPTFAITITALVSLLRIKSLGIAVGLESVYNAILSKIYL